MAKSIGTKINLSVDLAGETINTITKKAFPRVRNSKYDLYKYTDDCLFHYFKWNNTGICDYVNDNLEKSIIRFVKMIDTNEVNEDELQITKQLLASLTYICFDRQSKVQQDKDEIVYRLFTQNNTFKNVLKEYAKYIPELLGEIFFQAFRMLNGKVIEEITNEFISQYSKRGENYQYFVGSMPFKFTNCFINLPLWSEETSSEYFALCKYIDKTFPKMKFKEHQCYHFLQLAKQGAESLKDLAPLSESIHKNCAWIDVDKLPDLLEFDYIYPNGKNGDIIKYIFEEYGETSIVSGLTWNGKIEKKYIGLFEMFYSANTLTISNDSKYQKMFNEHHIPTIIANKLNDLVYEKANYFKRFREYQNLTLTYSKEQTKKRSEVYSQLILQGQTSPKWKSEAQLYALVSSLYPDAIYQYRCEWLHMQSLDIFVPSLSIGIEYQGIQHYKPIEHFGGEDHFKQQQDNDRKKRELCKQNGVKLIEWAYDQDISEAKLIEYIGDSKSLKSQDSFHTGYRENHNLTSANKTKRRKTGTTSSKANKDVLWPVEKKLEIVEKNIKDKTPVKVLAEEYKVSVSSLSSWVAAYKRYGESGLVDHRYKNK